MTIRNIFATLLAAAALGQPLGSAPLHAEAPGVLLAGVKTWAYLLKDVSPEKIDKVAGSAIDMVIIDPSMFPEGKEVRLTRDQVERMKHKPDGGRRLVIAYLSAGESEDFRDYWKPEWSQRLPSWVSKSDKDWKGDYVVKYWRPEWQSIVYSSPASLIDRIIDAGFDGISLDRVDAYYYFGDTEDRRLQMIEFVKNMTAYIRAKKPDAVVLAQDAEELLEHKDYVDVIDGVAKEDLMFGIGHIERMNTQGDIDHSTELLEEAKAAGKKIFVIEYLANKTNIARAWKFMREHDFVLSVGQRDLYELSNIVEPDARKAEAGQPAAAAAKRAN